ncbi:ATP-binding cassette domain-containing protein [Eisenbergiella sp.]|uniref:ATP-binding cassette domain-containing protein n=1 Tax=Eisenbergiella sp. TaxID=1924109 RepID=UPI0020806C82|nr:ATP-binding cassette domain-containing protein [Eisenbergiella sp.]BDF48913.1 ABC transporter ATP-binding protein [Lachnospiraceae bacterium]GKH44992.1 ABC transporter ATP-binding protein [Lachnospiraceae bacterium]
MSGIISLHNVTKKFGKKVVLADYNLDIIEREFICLTGESGSGKSTLLNLVGLLEKPTSGQINICGYVNPKLNSHTGTNLLRNEISYLFQNYGLIENETVLYNLKLATRFLRLKKKEETQRINNILDKLHLHKVLNDKVYCLSGGEQQRVSLARIMLKPSRILLADEPTGSLDEKNKKIVMDILSSLHAAGKTIVLVTHDLTLKEYATRTINLQQNETSNHTVPAGPGEERDVNAVTGNNTMFNEK